MPNKFQKIADPGVWIIFVLIILLIGYGFYSFFKTDGFNSKINNFIKDTKNSLGNMNISYDSSSDDKLIINSNVNTVTNNNINLNSNVDVSTRTVNTNTININTNNSSSTNINTETNVKSGDFKWHTLTPGGKLNVPEYKMEISVNHFDAGFVNATLNIYYADRDSYNGQELNAGDNAGATYFDNYPQDTEIATLLDYAFTAYRTHYYCDGTIDDSSYPLGREKIDLSSGYSNYFCRNMEYEQCQSETSDDTFYDEICDFENVVFPLNGIKCHDNYAIAIKNISGYKIDIGIADLSDGENCLDLIID